MEKLLHGWVGRRHKLFRRASGNYLASKQHRKLIADLEHFGELVTVNDAAKATTIASVFD